MEILRSADSTDHRMRCMLFRTFISVAFKIIFNKTDIIQNSQNRDDFVYAPSQWKTMLHCNIVSHWLGAYKKIPVKILWSLRCSFCGAISLHILVSAKQGARHRASTSCSKLAVLAPTAKSLTIEKVDNTDYLWWSTVETLSWYISVNGLSESNWQCHQ